MLMRRLSQCLKFHYLKDRETQSSDQSYRASKENDKSGTILLPGSVEKLNSFFYKSLMRGIVVNKESCCFSVRYLRWAGITHDTLMIILVINNSFKNLLYSFSKFIFTPQFGTVSAFKFHDLQKNPIALI